VLGVLRPTPPVTTRLLRLLDELDARGMSFRSVGEPAGTSVDALDAEPHAAKPVLHSGRSPGAGVLARRQSRAAGIAHAWLQVQAGSILITSESKQRKFSPLPQGLDLLRRHAEADCCFDQKTNRHGSIYHYFFCVGRQQKRTDWRSARYVSVRGDRSAGRAEVATRTAEGRIRRTPPKRFSLKTYFNNIVIGNDPHPTRCDQKEAEPRSEAADKLPRSLLRRFHAAGSFRIEQGQDHAKSLIRCR